MNKFKKIRLKLGLSQEELARKLGISVYTVVNYEREAPSEIMVRMDELLKQEGK